MQLVFKSYLLLKVYKNDVCVTKRIVFETIKLMSFDFLSLSAKHYRKLFFWHPNFYLFVEMELKFWRSSFISWTEMGVTFFITMIFLKHQAKFWHNFQLMKKISYQSIRHEQQLQKMQTIFFSYFNGYLLKGVLETVMEIANISNTTLHLW